MCGIAGIINKTPRTFDYSAFCTLGIANDSRGGDSCGVFIDGKYEYGVDKNKYFSNYFLDSDLLYDVKKSTIAFLHCRKASVGKISEATAQPVIITDDLGKVEFVVIHNGTIYNYEELAKKYIPEVNINGMTDSQVMARIFYHKGYDVLDEYNGGAVFAIADYRGFAPKVLFYKGASKKTEYSKEIEEERPLYYCFDKVKKELIFSSIAVHLFALRKESKVYIMRANALMELTSNGLSIIKEYKREKCTQTKKTTYYGCSGYGKGIDYGIRSYGRSTFFDDDDDDYVGSTYLSANLNSNIYSYKGESLHGKNFITNYGVVESKKSKVSHEVWFFKGIALKNAYCFRFLEALMKETKLDIFPFTKKFENVIRFLSVDGLYFDGGFMYKATSPTDRIPYTGVYQPLCSVSTVEYEEGREKLRKYNGSYTYTKEILESVGKHDINLKKIKGECKSLMK